jgi:uncharacterized membrane protein
VAPAELPKELHWFKWEAYSTWLSGIALLTIAYYFNAQAMMIDKSVADLSSLQAVGIGIGTLVIGWTVYDLLCRSRWASMTVVRCGVCADRRRAYGSRMC